MKPEDIGSSGSPASVPRRSPTWREFEMVLPEREPYETDATKKQKEYLWELGLRDRKIMDGLGKIQASKVIDAAKHKWGEVLAEDAKKKNVPIVITLVIILALIIFFIATAT